MCCAFICAIEAAAARLSISLRQLPNLISLFRLVLIVPIAAAVLHRDWTAALMLFALAAASDAADGFLAKRFGWQTDCGAVLDPVADKLLVATVFVTLAVQGHVPVWLMAAVIARDLVIVLGALSYRLWVGPVKMRPTVISKINTLIQLLYLFTVVVRRETALPAAWVVTLLGALVFVTIAVSGLDYVLTYAGRAYRAVAARRGAT